MHPIQEIVKRNKAGRCVGVYSCCSANADVVKAVLLKAKKTKTIALIESTSNQVNQYGGYTGLTPYGFSEFVYGLAAEVGLDRGRVYLGGDHLGPLPWSDELEKEAMHKAGELVRQCVLAGYSKIHLDTSMRVGSDDPASALAVEACARRGAMLAETAEQAFKEYQAKHPHALAPVYVLGSEVPIPGGATDAQKMGITDARDCAESIKCYKEAFAARGLLEAFDRVIAYVVEMGIEFHEYTLDEYDRAAARGLTDYMKGSPLAIEGHSTDYQTTKNLTLMCEDGCSILKVGPAFTFSLREGLFSLESIEKELYSDKPELCSRFQETLEQAMLEDSSAWVDYYRGSENEQRIARAYSFYDRTRYYLSLPQVKRARDVLIANLSGGVIPLCMLSQYLPTQYYRIRQGEIENDGEAILLDRIGDRIDCYLVATKNNGEM